MDVLPITVSDRFVVGEGRRNVFFDVGINKKQPLVLVGEKRSSYLRK